MGALKQPEDEKQDQRKKKKVVKKKKETEVQIEDEPQSKEKSPGKLFSDNGDELSFVSDKIEEMSESDGFIIEDLTPEDINKTETENRNSDFSEATAKEEVTKDITNTAPGMTPD